VAGGGVSAMDSCRPMGSRGLRWAPRGLTAGSVRTWVGPSSSAQLDRIDFLFFEIIFNAKQFQKKSRTCLKARKNTSKITKIPRKFPETHWDMNNPNKVFGAHEKGFRAF
jgi:hypothetical protein